MSIAIELRINWDVLVVVMAIREMMDTETQPLHILDDKIIIAINLSMVNGFVEEPVGNTWSALPI